MNPAVRDELFERDSRDLAANRIVARDDHCFGSIVDNDIDAGRGLDRADIAALAPDYAALHLIIGQREHRDGALGDELAGEAFDCDRDDSFRATVGLFARLFFDDPDMLGGVGARLSDHLVHQGALGLLASQSGDRLELGPRLVDQRLMLFLFFAEIFLARAETLIAAVEVRLAPFECFLALFESLLAGFEFLFDRSYLAPAIAHLTFGVGFCTDHQVFGL